jgi:acyl-CoA thioesterase-1
MGFGGWISMAAAALVVMPGASAQSPLTKGCQTPGVTISGAKPLTNVQRAIKDRKVLKILFIGASSSGGAQEPKGDYSELIEALLEKTIPGVDVRIIDRGISGELVADAAARLPAEVALTEPDIVLWQLGTADALARTSEDDFVASVTGALRWLKEHNVDVALVGPLYARSMRSVRHYQVIRVALRRLADRQNVLLVRRYEAMQFIEQARKTVTEGYLNEFALTEFGYTCLAEYVVRAVTAGLTAKSKKGKQAGRR